MTRFAVVVWMTLLGSVAADLQANTTTTATTGTVVKQRTIPAVWQVDQKTTSLTVNVEPFLSSKQRGFVNSGFTTFSLLELRTAPADPKNDTEAFLKLGCTVRFDTWNERYDVAHLSDKPRNRLVKSFDRYSQLCLNAQITDNRLLEQWRRDGARLYATLLVDQISISKAEEIKEWLIRQQSGVLQGLFAHMLGELKLTERLDAPVQVPPHTIPAQPTPAPPGKRWSFLRPVRK